ncbi:hypothetical protein BH10BDE1_BH10BDE1_30810 [soil metagenome]
MSRGCFEERTFRGHFVEIDLPTDKPARDPGAEFESEAVESIPEPLVRDVLGDSPDPMGFNSWAARPAPRRGRVINPDGFDFDALKIFLILAGLTAGMAFALRSLF